MIASSPFFRRLKSSEVDDLFDVGNILLITRDTAYIEIPPPSELL